MEGTGTRWLVTLFLLTAAQCPSRVTSQTERDSEDSRRVLGSRYVYARFESNYYPECMSNVLKSSSFTAW